MARGISFARHSFAAPVKLFTLISSNFVISTFCDWFLLPGCTCTSFNVRSLDLHTQTHVHIMYANNFVRTYFGIRFAFELTLSQCKITTTFHKRKLVSVKFWQVLLLLSLLLLLASFFCAQLLSFGAFIRYHRNRKLIK